MSINRGSSVSRLDKSAGSAFGPHMRPFEITDRLDVGLPCHGLEAVLI